jgi:ABC-2 type transport system permease protein
MSVMTSSRIPVAVATPPHGLRHDVRAVGVVWQRELIRFFNDRMRIVTALLQPVLFLFVLGNGLSSLTTAVPGGSEFNLKTFLFPGVLGMSVLFTAMFSAASIVWDREFGFLREMLVAPISRGSIVIGKCLGGATVATLQGMLILAMAGLVGVPYNPVLLITLIAEMALLSFTLTALGVVIAARLQSLQAFMAVNQMIVMPMFFLSGALYPLGNLPAWLAVLTRLDPLTYAISPMKHAVFDHLSIPPEVAARFDPGLTWFGWPVPVGLQVLVIACLGLSLLAIGIAEFRKAD